MNVSWFFIVGILSNIDGSLKELNLITEMIPHFKEIMDLNESTNDVCAFLKYT